MRRINSALTLLFTISVSIPAHAVLQMHVFETEPT